MSKQRWTDTFLVAISTGSNIEAIKMLLAAGSDVSSQDRHGNTPLHLAVSRRSDDLKIEIVAMLYLFRIKQRIRHCISQPFEKAAMSTLK